MAGEVRDAAARGCEARRLALLVESLELGELLFLLVEFLEALLDVLEKLLRLLAPRRGLARRSVAARRRSSCGSTTCR